LCKCWPAKSQSDISHTHEQKHLLYNRSNCCYRNRTQIARAFLEGWPRAAIAKSEEFPLPMRVATLGGFMVTSEQLTVFRLEISPRAPMSILGHFNFVKAASTLSSEVSL